MTTYLCVFTRLHLLTKRTLVKKLAWAAEQRTLHRLQSAETRRFSEKHTFRDISLMAEEAKMRAEIARLVFY
jgi:hypothetical protein